MLQRLVSAVAFLATLGCGGVALASVSVFGATQATACSEAAKAGRSDSAAIAACTDAIDNEALTRRDLAGTHVNRATMYLRRRDWTTAARDLDTAMGIDGQLGEVHVNRGAAFLGLRRYKEAIAEIDLGLQFGTEEPEKAYFNRAVADELIDDLKAAYFDYRKAAELAPKWDEPRQALTRFKVSVRN